MKPTASAPFFRVRQTALCGALVLGALLLAGCAGRLPMPPTHTLTVEGRVTARGAMPETAYVLETDGRNRYVLDLPADLRGTLSTPTRARVTGRLYQGQWQGRPYAHLAVASFETLQ